MGQPLGEFGKWMGLVLIFEVKFYYDGFKKKIQ